MIYKVDGETFESIDDVVEYCVNYEYYDDYYDDFDEWLDIEYGTFYIDGTPYSASDILNKVDPDEYYNLKYKYCKDKCDNDADELRYDLDRADNGETVECQAYTILCIDEDAKEEEDEEIDNEPVESSVESTRRYLNEQKLLEEDRKAKEKQEDDDIMKIFQVISA